MSVTVYTREVGLRTIKEEGCEGDRGAARKPGRPGDRAAQGEVWKCLNSMSAGSEGSARRRGTRVRNRYITREDDVRERPTADARGDEHGLGRVRIRSYSAGREAWSSPDQSPLHRRTPAASNRARAGWGQRFGCPSAIPDR